MASEIEIRVSPTALNKIQRLIATGLLLVFWSNFLLALIASSVMAFLVVPTFMQSMASFGATPPALLVDAGLRFAFFSALPGASLVVALVFTLLPRRRITAWAVLAALTGFGAAWLVTLGLPAILLFSSVQSLGSAV
jgi:hypothetical protein